MQIDYGPLESFVTDNDIRDAKLKYGSAKYWTTLYDKDVEPTDDIKLFILTFIGCIVLFAFANISLVNYFNAVDRTRFIAFVLVAIFVILSTVIYRTYKKISAKNIQDSIRLDRFANANGMKFIKYADNPSHKGMIFSVGRDQIAYNQLINNTKSRAFEIGNYQCTYDSGKNKHTKSYGYVIIKLDRHLPHIVLDAKLNNTKLLGVSMSNLPIKFDKSQILSLEGDFDSYFTLYAPKEYKRDALYVFTPDLMALFIDKSGLYDAEVIDNQLYIYSSKPFNLSDRPTLERLFNIIHSVGSKIISQTDYYADESIGNRNVDSVGIDGRRLRSSISWAVVVFAAIYTIYIIYTVLQSLLP